MNRAFATMNQCRSSARKVRFIQAKA
jgi:hypothetical protein